MGQPDFKTDEGLQERIGQETKEPRLFRVLLLNDDYTTMDFVVSVLENVFHKTAVEAAQIMLNVHKNGIGLAGIYTREIAETKVALVLELAVRNGFPLKCRMEKE